MKKNKNVACVNRLHPRNSVTRREILAGMSGLALLGACTHAPPEQQARPTPTGDDVLDAMLRATRFMRERCAVNGGYVWSYAEDFSRRWGAMEAYESMIWIQPPGTATMGHLYLDCYHASGHEYFYESAAEVAHGLIAAQHPSGGWNYMHDFNGEESMRGWYDTIGRNGWRLEEFHHYYGNATFGDAGTAEASQFLLRMYLEKRDPLFGQALGRAVGFVLDGQYDNGGWPLRYPGASHAGEIPDYTRQISFDEDIGGENIKFLLMVYQALGDQRALAAIYRAMAIYPATLQALPQAGWGLMHSVETLAPVGARSYEPVALVTSTTATNASRMMDFYEWTGEQQFLERLPEVFTWLDSVRLAADEDVPGRRFPTFIELGSNKSLYSHRRGSNVVNGEYYQDYDPAKPIQHYPQWQAIDLEGLRDRFRRLMLTTPADVAPASPLNRQTGFALPRYFTLEKVEIPDLTSDLGNPSVSNPDENRVRELLETLTDDGSWPTRLAESSYRYTGDPPPRVATGDFSETQVGDKSDTSPFLVSNPQLGISTGTFIRNMSELMQAFAAAGEAE
jgi:hypothetical protein